MAQVEGKTEARVLARSSKTLNQCGSTQNKRMEWILRNIMKETSTGFGDFLDLRKISG